jgi:hypothetical protein
VADWPGATVVPKRGSATMLARIVSLKTPQLPAVCDTVKVADRHAQAGKLWRQRSKVLAFVVTKTVSNNAGILSGPRPFIRPA